MRRIIFVLNFLSCLTCCCTTTSIEIMRLQRKAASDLKFSPCPEYMRKSKRARANPFVFKVVVHHIHFWVTQNPTDRDRRMTVSINPGIYRQGSIVIKKNQDQFLCFDASPHLTNNRMTDSDWFLKVMVLILGNHLNSFTKQRKKY